MSRRKKGGDAPEGGGWKGAFADFCMSMMTLFMVLWIVTSADATQRQGLSVYFSNPGVFDTPSSPFPMGNASEGKVIELDNGGKALPEKPDVVPLHKAGGDPFEVQVTKMAKQRDNLKVKKIKGGLLLQLVETDDRPMFKIGSDQLTPYFEDMLMELGPMIVKTGQNMAIIGHTDSVPYGKSSRNNNWILSYMRANSVREMLDYFGMPDNRFTSVSGMASSQLLDKKHPGAAINRRVELIILDRNQGKSRDNDNPTYSQIVNNARAGAEYNQI
ncbi:OmpA family protein [Sansalvadorimonas sp. 2012CJ34-2]|uniref:OmpA family protein n=1 Tax=Parendozoicomonas callyspongiae TaxID=2942213 RepID=A0ABT0PKZ6_9GAMM|nr:flagellar motor protein MotB [Sansalvadorimonas sp. 2012CJ34-2]MCL6272067.1 OmpA family protein [Sansalvadorimonas sp. 2012CJ34-2]